MCASRCDEIAGRIQAKTKAMKPSELTKPNQTVPNSTEVNCGIVGCDGGFSGFG